MKKINDFPVPPPKRKELSNNPVKMCHDISHLSSAKMRAMSDTEESAAPRGTRMVLSFLAAGDGVTQLDLVHATHLRAPTVSVILKNLESEGYVDRRQDEKDMRSLRVYLTESGRELDRRNIEKIKHIDSLALEGLTDEERDTAMIILGKIRDNLLREDKEENN